MRVMTTMALILSPNTSEYARAQVISKPKWRGRKETAQSVLLVINKYIEGREKADGMAGAMHEFFAGVYNEETIAEID